jgi:hypothetical protein
MASTQPADFYERLFLNPPRHHGGAYILAEVTSGENPSNRWVASELKISDCARVIELDFPVGYPDARQASMFKLDLLIETLTAFRSALQAGCAWVDAYEEERKEAKEPVPAQ